MPRLIGSTSTHSALPDVTIDQHHARDHGAAQHTAATGNSSLSGDVTIGVANTYVDGPSVSLVAGTWLVVLHLNFNMLTAASFYGRITDGATHYASGQARPGSGGCALALAAIITLVGTTTIKGQATADAGATNTITAATTADGSGNNASGIRAYRLA